MQRWLWGDALILFILCVYVFHAVCAYFVQIFYTYIEPPARRRRWDGRLRLVLVGMPVYGCGGGASASRTAADGGTRFGSEPQRSAQAGLQ